MKKQILLVLIIIGFVLIGGGLYLNSTTSQENNNSNKETPKDNNYVKKYQTIDERKDETFVETTIEEQENNYKKMGFTDIKCEGNVCDMSKSVGTDPKDKDIVNVTFHEGKLDFVAARLLYKKDSFDAKTVANDLNTIINNYIGYKIDEEFVNEGKTEFLKITDGSNYSKTIEYGDYTITYIMGEYNNLYNCSLKIVLTSRLQQ